jgi:murein DD-endopeptidase MepM/ murein hydrolase activator NlpD
MPLRKEMRVTSKYGYRTDPITGKRNTWHGGLDLISADRAVLASVSGVVAVSQIVTDKSDPTWEWGNYVCILGDDGRYIYYCHLAERLVVVGQRVVAGQQIGVMGTTGYSTGVHLHFEVRDASNKQMDAASYLGIANEVGEVATKADSGTSWSDEAVAWAQENGIIYGDGEGNLMLDEPCTRRQMVVFLHRMWKLVTGR